MIEQKQGMLPSSFKCAACRLVVTGLSRLTACDLANTFTATVSFPASEFFGLHTDEDLQQAVLEAAAPWEQEEPDFNE